MRRNPVIVYIPDNMVRGKLYRGDILCSFLTKKEKKYGVRFYKLDEKTRAKGITTYRNLNMREILFDSMVSRISSDHIKKISDSLQSFEKEFNPKDVRSLSDANLDEMIKNRKFFIIR